MQKAAESRRALGINMCAILSSRYSSAFRLVLRPCLLATSTDTRLLLRRLTEKPLQRSVHITSRPRERLNVLLKAVEAHLVELS